MTRNTFSSNVHINILIYCCLVKQVFSDMDFLGWYTTGDTPNESDIHVHKQICEINESPVILKLNPFTRNADLPVTMYESVIDLVNGEATMLFVELNYTLATEEAERIGVDHVARMASGDSAESSQGILFFFLNKNPKQNVVYSF